jgi:hypothetical protein
VVVSTNCAARAGTGQQGELLAAARRVAGLIQHFASAYGDLVAANHGGPGESKAHGLGLGEPQALRALSGRLAGDDRLVHQRWSHFKGQSEPPQQLTPVEGSRRQHQRWRLRCGRSHARAQRTVKNGIRIKGL